MAPIIIELTRALKRNPVPYLIAGRRWPPTSAARRRSPVNPQNMIIGHLSHIPYGNFAAALAPVAAIGLVLTIVSSRFQSARVLDAQSSRRGRRSPRTITAGSGPIGPHHRR